MPNMKFFLLKGDFISRDFNKKQILIHFLLISKEKRNLENFQLI